MAGDAVVVLGAVGGRLAWICTSAVLIVFWSVAGRLASAAGRVGRGSLMLKETSGEGSRSNTETRSGGGVHSPTFSQRLPGRLRRDRHDDVLGTEADRGPDPRG